ncbi:MAG: hypothetical protein WC058_01230 [Phycisphaeraceae bacterium]
MLDPHRQQRLQQFVAWCKQHITGDEKGEAQIFLDRLFQAFGQPGCKDVGGTPKAVSAKPAEEFFEIFTIYSWLCRPRRLISKIMFAVCLPRHAGIK